MTANVDQAADEERRREERAHVSAVLVVDNDSYCDREAAQLLIQFAAPSIRALSRRRTLGQVRDTLLWCTFAWNHAKRATAAEELAVAERDFGRYYREAIEDLFRARLDAEYAAIEKEIGGLRVTRLASGAVAVYVDSRPTPEPTG